MPRASEVDPSGTTQYKIKLPQIVEIKAEMTDVKTGEITIINRPVTVTRDEDTNWTVLAE